MSAGTGSSSGKKEARACSTRLKVPSKWRKMRGMSPVDAAKTAGIGLVG
jgi:hypothetical protein